MDRIKIFAPAGIGNISCGFDILGFPINGVGDTLEIRTTSKLGIVIEEIRGYAGNLPTDPEKNICGVIARAMIDDSRFDKGVSMVLTKGVMSGSGLGSSASSSAAAAFAMNQILNKPYTTKQLITFAMLGEKLASGTPHADNVAPALLGGITLIRQNNPLDVVQIPVPDDLFVSVIHPQIEIQTAMARSVLKKQIDLPVVVNQLGNVAGLVAGFFLSDYDLIGRSLKDYIAEPFRAPLIPGFDNITAAAKMAGALGGGISGSGPSVFALSKSQKVAENVAIAMQKEVDKLNIANHVFVSAISKTGCRIIQ